MRSADFRRARIKKRPLGDFPGGSLNSVGEDAAKTSASCKGFLFQFACVCFALISRLELFLGSNRDECSSTRSVGRLAWIFCQRFLARGPPHHLLA